MAKSSSDPLQPRLILASGSPRRVALLRQLGLRFVVRPPQVTELAPPHLTARELAQLNAWRKARAVAQAYPDAVVLGADTVVCLGRSLFGKPANLTEAHDMLARLQGRTHDVITGVCLVHLRQRRQTTFAVRTRVTFRRLRPAQIRDYLQRIHPLDKAGAYAIQENGDRIVARIAGSFTNVVGLPLERLRDELAAWGIRIRPWPKQANVPGAVSASTLRRLSPTASSRRRRRKDRTDRRRANRATAD